MRILNSVFLLLTIINYSFGAKYYVSADGSDSNSGASVTSPWKSFTKVNAITYTGGDTIFFRRGDVFIGQFNLKGSGTASAPIVVSAYGSGNAPVISGAKDLSGGWTKEPGKEYYKKSGIADNIKMLVVNNKTMTPARTPNAGWFTISAAILQTPNYRISTSNPAFPIATADFYKDATFHIKTSDWTIHRASGLVYSPSSSGVTVTAPEYAPKSQYGFFIEGKKEFVDSTSEWFYDFNSSTLYLYPRNGVDPTTMKVEGTVFENGINGGNGLSNWVIDNIAFKGQFAKGIVFASSNNINVQNSHFQNIAGTAVSFTSGASNNVKNCTFEDIHSRGVDAMLVNNSEVSGNSFKRIGLIRGMASGFAQNQYVGIYFDKGASDLITNNTLDSIGYIGIRGDFKDGTISKNIVKDGLLLLTDGGLIYSGNTNLTPGQAFNNTIINNIVINAIGDASGTPDPVYGIAKSIGIYLDNGCASYKVLKNTVTGIFGTGIFIGGKNKNHVVRENIIYNGTSKEGYYNAPKYNYISSFAMAEDTTGNPMIRNSDMTITKNVFVSRGLNQRNITLIHSGDVNGPAAFPRLKLDSNYYSVGYDVYSVKRTSLLGAAPDIHENIAIEQWMDLVVNGGNGKEPKGTLIPYKYPTHKVNNYLTGNLLKYPYPNGAENSTFDKNLFMPNPDCPDCGNVNDVNTTNNKSVWGGDISATYNAGTELSYVTGVLDGGSMQIRRTDTKYALAYTPAANDLKNGWQQTGFDVDSLALYEVKFSIIAPSASTTKYNRLWLFSKSIPDLKRNFVSKYFPYMKGKRYDYTYYHVAEAGNSKFRLDFQVESPAEYAVLDNVTLKKVDAVERNPDIDSKLLLNETSSAKTFALATVYKDINGNDVSGTVSVEPFSSMVLFNSEMVNGIKNSSLNNVKLGYSVLFPNPVKKDSKINIEIDELFTGNATVEISDVLGQSVYTSNSYLLQNNNIQVHPFLEKGMYLIKVSTAEKVYQNKILITE